MKQGLITAVALLVAGALFALAFIYSGLFPIAANDANSAFKEWVFGTTMEEAVADRADEVEVPANLVTDERVAKGVAHYDSMCVMCHGAPGKERATFAEHMTPEPPEMTHAAEEWSAAAVFWITKHGIEMSGMPAWAPDHSTEDLWSVVAAVSQFPEMSPERYAELAKQGGHDQQAPQDQPTGGGPTDEPHHDDGHMHSH
ncbi:c-type cytochrome [Persicimonas caeni]|nr:cytochrome c [Persicimonas caeni]